MNRLQRLLAVLIASAGLPGHAIAAADHLITATAERAPAATVNAGVWTANFALDTGCNGPINVVIARPAGGYFVAGHFSACAGIAANSIAVYDPGSERWSSLQSEGDAGNGVSGEVHALHLHDGELYVGGDINAVNQGGTVAPAGGLARWDGVRWQAINIPGVASAGPFGAIGSHDGSVYVGGSTLFRVDGNLLRQVDETSSAISGRITELLSFNGQLHASGVFNIPNAPLVRVARWTGTDWQRVGSDGGIGPNSTVNAMQVWNGALYVAGQFTALNVSNSGTSVVANRVARWDGTQWSAVGGGLDAPAQALRVVAGHLYAAGAFTLAGGVPAKHVARWDGSNWTGFDSGPAGFPARVLDLVQTAQGFAVAGEFGWIASTAAPATPMRVVNSVAEFRDGQWRSWGSADGLAMGANWIINASAHYQGQLYVGGHFTAIGGIAANHLARWDGQRWHAVGQAGGNGVDGPVHALQATPDGLYVGGAFLHVDVGGAHTSARRITRWDGARWHQVGDGDQNGFNAAVLALAWASPHLYAGGAFRSVIAGESGFAANGIARWNGSEWSVLRHADSGGNGLFANVKAIAVQGANVYAAVSQGAVDAGEQPFGARSVMRWDGTQWQLLDVPGGGGLNMSVVPMVTSVDALLVWNGQLYAGGLFSAAGEGSAQPTALSNLARWDGERWHSIAGGGPNRPVWSLTELNGQLAVGGQFTGIDQPGLPALAAHGVALWDGGHWSSLGAGVRGGRSPMVRTLSGETDVGLYGGGLFGQAGTYPASNLALFEQALFSSGFE